MNIGDSKEINSKKEKNVETPKEKENFFQMIISTLFKSSSPDIENKRRLKAIAKNIAKTKYHAFYKSNTFELTPQFAKLFYDFYRLVSPSKKIFDNQENETLFKRQIINYSLSQQQIDILEHFDQQKIIEMSKKISITELEKQIELDLNTFTMDFDGEKTEKIENLYKGFIMYKDFCSFDYYILLKKFKSTLKENSFTSEPLFEKINADYVLDDMKDFVVIAYALTDNSIDWNPLFAMLKERYGNDVIQIGTWKKIITKINSIRDSKVLDYIIQHVSKNPEYQVKVSFKSGSLIDPYIDSIQTETRDFVAKIKSNIKEDKTTSLMTQVFGSEPTQVLKYYTQEMNGLFSKKQLTEYIYTDALNYLKVFLVDFVKKNIREFFDVVVIRGQWDSALSSPISNAYQDLLKISDKISDLDESLADESSIGMKIKTLLPKTAHDPGAESIINRLVEDANDLAKTAIVTSTQNLILIGRTIKQLIEDYAKPKPVIVQNWKELEKFIDVPMKDFSVGIYKKIYYFVQLMQTYLTM